MNVINQLLIPLLLTIALECSVASIFDIKKEEYKYVIIINIITNLSLNTLGYFINMIDNRIIHWSIVLVLETLIFYIEALYFGKKIKLKNKYIFSLSLNGVSFLTGLIASLL